MRKFKRFICLVLPLLLCLTSINFNPGIVYAVDAKGPSIDHTTLKVDKTEVTVGDEVTFSVKVTDDTGIDRVNIQYKKPISGQNKQISMAYNSETELYEGTLTVTESETESGLWKVYCILAYDTHGYYTFLYNNAVTSGAELQEDLSTGDFEVTGTIVDTDGPSINHTTLKVDKTEATVGDKITISVEVTDDTGIEIVNIYYKMPISEERKQIRMLYNSETELYEAALTVTESETESGLWKVLNLQAVDMNGNYSYLYNDAVGTPSEDLFAGNFEVTGTTVDTDGPSIDYTTLKVDKTEAFFGDNVTISVKVTDDTAVDRVYVDYKMPISGDTKKMKMSYNGETELYEVTLTVTESATESGLWKVDCIIAADTNGYHTFLYNNELRPYATLKENLSAGDFEIYEDERYLDIDPIENIKVYTSSGTISNQTITGDVYIGPKAVLTMNNVKVNGNIYVLGALKANSITTNAVYANRFLYSSTGSTTLSNGTVTISGTNSVTSFSASNYPLINIPIHVDAEKSFIKDGYLTVRGVIPNVVDLYIGDTLINTSHNGKFIVESLYIGDVNEFTFSAKTVFGNTINKKYSVDVSSGQLSQVIPLESISLNKSQLTLEKGKIETLTVLYNPEQTTENKTVTWTSGDKTVATVDETGKVTAVGSGTTTITAKVGEKTATCKITVTSALESISLNETSLELEKGKSEKLIVTYHPTDTTDDKTVTWTSGDKTVAVVDETGKVTAVGAGITTITAKVEEKTATCLVKVLSNEKPIINKADALTLKVGDPFDEKKDVTAIDSEDGDLTSKIVITGSVDATKAGKYVITYSVTDSDDNTTNLSRVITVENLAEVSGIKVSSRSTSSLKLTWTKQSGVTGYQVYRYDPASKGYKLVKTITGANTNSYTASGLSAATAYKFIVRAYKTSGDATYYGSYSNVLDAVTSPSQVKNVKVSSRSATSLKLTWTKQSGVTGYQVYRYHSSSKSYKLVKTITGANTNSYTASGLSAATTYKYKVRSYKTSGGVTYYSSYSNMLDAVTSPFQVKNVKVSSRSTTSLKLMWTKLSGVTGYQVYRYNPASKSYKLVKTVKGAAVNSYTVSKISAGTTYKFKVRAYKTIGGKSYYGSYSSILTTSTKPVTVSLSSVKSNSSKNLTVNWKKAQASTGYQIQYSTSSKFSSTTKNVTITNKDTVTKNIKGLAKGKKYYVRVRAYKTLSGTKYYGSWSNVKSVRVK